MTKASRKPRYDSTAEQSRIMQGSVAIISPPGHVPLEAMDLPFWEDVVAEFASADWSEHALTIAAMLARTMANLEEEQRLLRQEGATITKEFRNPDGSVRKILSCPNSRARAVSDYMGQVLSLRRSLALHARAKSGTNQDAAKQRDAGKATEKRGMSKSELLA